MLLYTDTVASYLDGVNWNMVYDRVTRDISNLNIFSIYTYLNILTYT